MLFKNGNFMGMRLLNVKLMENLEKNAENLSGLLWITLILTFIFFTLWGDAMSCFVVTFP